MTRQIGSMYVNSGLAEWAMAVTGGDADRAERALLDLQTEVNRRLNSGRAHSTEGDTAYIDMPTGYGVRAGMTPDEWDALLVEVSGQIAAKYGGSRTIGWEGLSA